MSEQNQINNEVERIKSALIIPLFFMIIIFTIRLIEHIEGFSLVKWGIKPMSLEGLPGILLAPLIHSDWEHLYANSYNFV